ncbi:PDGLE domain-containing protein [Microbacterium sp.]|uniref:PDGLE domain-containing protein n=1 Tax=Microbacterium sp. TaxID=51671 RepID=UPI0025FB7711|nr:PDGLE domain-containing protein [Microbacterium sp.]
MTEPADATRARGRLSTRAFTIIALTVALLIACVVSVMASSNPDGLEFVAGATGFLDTATDSAAAGTPLADYATQGVSHTWLSTAIAGAIGCVVTFGLAASVGLVARGRRRTR